MPTETDIASESDSVFQVWKANGGGNLKRHFSNKCMTVRSGHSSDYSRDRQSRTSSYFSDEEDVTSNEQCDIAPTLTEDAFAKQEVKPVRLCFCVFALHSQHLL